MAKDSDVGNTLGDTRFGSSLDDLSDGDLSRGYSNAGPKGNYEGSLDADETFEFGAGGRLTLSRGGTLHAGQIEPDGYRETHDGDVPDEYGFLRRPRHRSDVERT